MTPVAYTDCHPMGAGLVSCTDLSGFCGAWIACLVGSFAGPSRLSNGGVSAGPAMAGKSLGLYDDRKLSYDEQDIYADQ